MEERKKKWNLKIIGLFFILIGISAIVNTIYRDDLAPILWLCYIGVLLIGIGILKNDGFLIASQLNILAIPLIFWNVDFFFGLFNGFETLFGIVDYYFIPGPLIGKIISAQHLFTLPLTLYALYLIKVKRRDAWVLSFFQLIFAFILTWIVTDPSDNVNCIFEPCANFIPANFYFITWFGLGFALIFISNFVLNRIKFIRD